MSVIQFEPTSAPHKIVQKQKPHTSVNVIKFDKQLQRRLDIGNQQQTRGPPRRRSEDCLATGMHTTNGRILFVLSFQAQTN